MAATTLGPLRLTPSLFSLGISSRLERVFLFALPDRRSGNHSMSHKAHGNELVAFLLIQPVKPPILQTHSAIRHQRRSEAMKMNNQNENIVTHFFAWLAAVASMLGITTQDMVYILFGFIGVVISLASFVLGRMDARKERNEDSKRTQLLADYLHGVQQKPVRERPSSAEVITESMNRINNDGATD
ncbi:MULTISPECIES: hypothetical protein [Klebsiella pneumoniae complex]|uniref:hypothetical protein n=1 Tax=Klebsiella pneumoniae complex TaxID=3390273 RepID=UPI001EEB4324|nr:MULTISPECIES: hypothetical protein [Klebsiella]